MLDNETKRRIDTARDILVGIVPDPKSQVEQITIALIYKFMDDMDKEAVDFGGKATFFTGEYEKYSWTKIFDPKIGGHELVNLYGEAIVKLNINPNIPQLFRDIFKNAYLPYRNPETLKMFLKTINDFRYDHSEMLGDAFEYLLSVLGSQGDAGQFRTPRHIIDFIVQVLDPKKGETIADPACGTAGFLISAYKYIINQNTKKITPKNHINHSITKISGSDLTPDDRKKLMQNLTGYDISPDMVRLSLVNMYLHGFTTPNIFEYDTLTSEERWNEYYDIVLANPPFMTPKGGIKPHKKFTVQATKSEVLFTDYIAEHINPTTGRAGIIVPNGIVATSQTAYKELRKMLVRQSLLAVISLPAGVFNPYSGVKTSVLILDRRLAKMTDQILFVKIENDGFDLGAQRREIQKNDLPAALEIITAYKKFILSEPQINTDFTDSVDYKNHNQSSEPLINTDLPDSVDYKNHTNHSIKNISGSDIFTIVPKKTILENKDVVLSAERYIKAVASLTEFEIIKIGDLFKTSSGGTPLRNKQEYYKSGTIPWLKSGEVAQGYIYSSEEFISEEGLKNSSAKLFPINSVLVAMYGATAGQVGILKFEATTNQAICAIHPNDKVIPEYLYLILKEQTQKFVDLSTGGGQPNISQTIIKDFQIPLPPLAIQQQIVSEIEGYQKIIDGAKQIVNNYKPTIEINADWEMVVLREIAELRGGGTPSKEIPEYWNDGKIDWITCSDFSDNEMYIQDSIRKITEKGLKESSASLIPANTLILVTRVSLGKMAFAKKPTAINQDLTAIIFNESRINKFFVYYYLKSIADIIESNGHGATVKGVTREFVKDLSIPLPPISEQESIVKAIDEEMQIVAQNKRLIQLFEAKIKNKIAAVWGV